MIILSVLTLLSFTVTAETQIIPSFDIETFNPFPSGFSIFPSTFNPFSKFPSFTEIASFFGNDWGKKLEERIISTIENASKANGISVVNGTTTITQTIGGKKYTAVVPKGASYSIRTSSTTINGSTTNIVRLTIDGKTAVYKTVSGKTTVTDEKGNPLSDGDFFGVANTIDTQVTDVPGPTEPPGTPKTEAPEGPVETTKAPEEPSTEGERTENRDSTTVTPESEETTTTVITRGERK
ncbi:unnamed protein product [Strongylus vulgaris]|uniref:Uncharacterized protein n=1 Tax=Strongylus vulgaris TaxID=40348 RepID=A0A3P7J5F3_STRVU|nr:unnamed protein product [Strongylus vulgaris]